MMGTESIYNLEGFQKALIMPFIERLMTNVREKNITNKHYNVKKYITLALLSNNNLYWGSEVKFSMF